MEGSTAMPKETPTVLRAWDTIFDALYPKAHNELDEQDNVSEDEETEQGQETSQNYAPGGST